MYIDRNLSKNCCCLKKNQNAPRPSELLFKKNLNASKPPEHPPHVEECLKVVVDSHIQRIVLAAEETSIMVTCTVSSSK